MQDNHSRSARHVLRGLHYQIEQPQGKLVRVIAGEVFDVAVDLRRSSPTFGRCVGCVLSGQNRRMLWMPPGFAHGFLVLSDHAEFLYKTTDYYDRSTSARCCGTTRSWRFRGHSTLSRSCPPRIARGSRWQMPKSTTSAPASSPVARFVTKRGS